MAVKSNYSIDGSTTASALCRWRFSADQATTTSVLPDGCRDFIVAIQADGQVSAFVTTVDSSCYQVRTAAGVLMTGIRLQPGVLLDERSLQRFLADHDPIDLFGGNRLEEFCRSSPAVLEALACLAQTEASVRQAASRIGVSTRTLQRVVQQGTGRSPGFWRALARARRAGSRLAQFDRLADAAHAHQYADQAHLCREMRRWFGATPSSIMSSESFLAMLSEPGYATPATGEQISTKNPLGSVT